MLTVHSQVAALRMALAPDAAATAEAGLRRLAEIIMEMPAHTAAAEATLAAQLGRTARGQVATQAGEPSGAEYLAVMASVSALLDLTEHASAGTPETVAQWRQMADDSVARARALGQPVTRPRPWTGGPGGAGGRRARRRHGAARRVHAQAPVSPASPPPTRRSSR